MHKLWSVMERHTVTVHKKLRTHALKSDEECSLCIHTINTNWCLLSLQLDECMQVMHNGLDYWSRGQQVYFWQASIGFHFSL